ncbi:MAG: hypothetical protein ACOC32_02090 [Nanoarchaeota archaeon]
MAAAKKTLAKRLPKRPSASKKTTYRAIRKEEDTIDEYAYGLKELIHGILIGLAVGFVLGVLIFKGGL